MMLVMIFCWHYLKWKAAARGQLLGRERVTEIFYDEIKFTIIGLRAIAGHLSD
jgi:hypothetical protein